jgi:CheY-like chemotaxis protein
LACNGGYVLVVDDDLEVQRALAIILAEDYGHAVKTAGDGREALQILRDSPPPSLILVDLMMPRMDGATFMEHKNAEPALAGVPCCVMTASSPWDEALSRFASAGQRELSLLRKPFDLEDLMSIVARYC